MKIPVLVEFSEWGVGLPFSRPYRAWSPYFPDLRFDGETEAEAIDRLVQHLRHLASKGLSLTEVEI